MFKLKPKLPFAVVISNPHNENKVDQKITNVLSMEICLILKLKNLTPKADHTGNLDNTKVGP